MKDEALELLKIAKQIESGLDEYKDPLTIEYEDVLQKHPLRFMPSSGYWYGKDTKVWAWDTRLSADYSADQVNVTIYSNKQNKILIVAGGYGFAQYQLDNRGTVQLRYGISKQKFAKVLYDFIDSLKSTTAKQIESSPRGRAQVEIMKWIDGNLGVGDSVSLTDISRSMPYTIHFGQLQNSAEVLARKGMIDFDGKDLTKIASAKGDIMKDEALELLKIAKELEGKGKVPEAFKKQWKKKDKDGDGKTNEAKPPWLKKSANPSKLEDLPKSEQSVAEKMKAKGYQYIVQVTANGKNFGEPLYFKSANEVGPFLRSFPDSANAKTAWNFKI